MNKVYGVVKLRVRFVFWIVQVEAKSKKFAFFLECLGIESSRESSKMYLAECLQVDTNLFLRSRMVSSSLCRIYTFHLGICCVSCLYFQKILL